MIGRRIELFEKFGLWTEVSKYYDKTHRSYLLIARLSKKSREMLDTIQIILIIEKYQIKRGHIILIKIIKCILFNRKL